MSAKNYKPYEKNCFGDSNDLRPCQYIDDCELCVNNTHAVYDCEVYVIGRGCSRLKCKRDNPDFKGLTKQQVFEMYKRLQKIEPVSITEILDFARIEGILIEE